MGRGGQEPALATIFSNGERSELLADGGAIVDFVVVLLRPLHSPLVESHRQGQPHGV